MSGDEVFRILAVGEDRLHALLIHVLVDDALTHETWPRLEQLAFARGWIEGPEGCLRVDGRSFLKLSRANAVARGLGFSAFRRARDWDGPTGPHTADLRSAWLVARAWGAHACVALRDTDDVRDGVMADLDQYLQQDGSAAPMMVVGAPAPEAESWLIIAAPDDVAAPLTAALGFDVRAQPQRLRSTAPGHGLDAKAIALRLGVGEPTPERIAELLRVALAHPAAAETGLSHFVQRLRGVSRSDPAATGSLRAAFARHAGARD